MNKSELIERIAEAAGLSKSDASHAVDAVMGSISAELGRGGNVRLVGFGTFTTSSRKARHSRDPRTGEIVSSQASVSPSVKAGKQLKATNTQLKITKIGNSAGVILPKAGVILPKEVLARLRVGPGDVLHLSEAPDGVRLTAGNADFVAKMESAEAIMREDRDILRVLAK